MDASFTGNLADFVADHLREPHITIRPFDDAIRVTIGSRYGVPGDLPTGGDASDLICSLLSEPEVAIRP